MSVLVILNTDIFCLFHAAAILNLLTCVCLWIVSYKKNFAPLIFIQYKSATQRHEYWCEDGNLIFLSLCFTLQINKNFHGISLYVKISMLLNYVAFLSFKLFCGNFLFEKRNLMCSQTNLLFVGCHEYRSVYETESWRLSCSVQAISWSLDI